MARRNRTANASPGDPLWTSHLKPAPGELGIVQAFVNTEGDAKATDEIASPRGLAAWLERWRLLPPDTELTADEHSRACANAECRLLFFDQSPNRSARWCAKGLCGNLVHSRTFRRRHPGYYDDF